MRTNNIDFTAFSVGIVLALTKTREIEKMRLKEHSNKLETNCESKSQDFSIGESSVIIDILRNRLYEHKIRTSCQEIISNARDAHREVEKGNDFEITVPTRLNPVFKVRDFGPSITPDRMENVFIRYGSSTKRDTNSQTGGFGIGGKSFFSYTDSFTITTFIEGTKRVYIAHIGVNHQGRLDLISTEKTSEPTGLEFQVAVKQHDIEEFRSSIFRAIYFWKDKPTLKGELNPPTLVRGEVVSELLEVIDQELLPSCVWDHNSEMIAVIDGIPYGVNYKILEKIEPLKNLNGIVRKLILLHFSNGVVEVSASRESIADSKHTLANMEKLGQKALLEAQTHISEAFGKVKTTSEYLKTYSALSKVFDVDNFAKYGDYSISGSRVQNPLFKKIKMTMVHCMNKYSRSRVDKITKDEMSEGRREIDIERLPHLFFVTKQESKLIQNKRAREYFKNTNYLVIIELLETVTATMKDGKPVLDKDNKQVFHPVSYPKEFAQVVKELGARDFTSITYVDPPKVVKAKVKREDEEICIHQAVGDRHKYVTRATNTQKWIFVRLEEGSWPAKYPRNVLHDLQDYTNSLEKFKVCGLADKAANMVEGDPNFIELKDYLDNFKVTKELVLAAKTQLSKNSKDYANIATLKDIEDEFLLEIMAEYKAMNNNKISGLPSLLANKIADAQEVKDFKEMDEKFGKLMKNEYPLVEAAGYYHQHKKEVTFYINAKYNANKKGK